MRLRFSKMHGLGNDFMVVDAITQEVRLDASTIRALADRHTGIGFDQLLLVEAPTDPAADFWYRIFNADGSPAEQCGNGARCVARFVEANHLASRSRLTWQTTSGSMVTCNAGDNVEVDIGVPGLDPASLPATASLEAATHTIALSVGDAVWHAVPVSIGNPHAVLFVDSVLDAPVQEVGAALTRHAVFPQGANIGFCEVVEPTFVRLRVFERGVGETRACGTGACAAAVAGIVTGRLRDRVKVSLPGGKLRITWPGEGQPVRLSGPATQVFDGVVEI
ncbi:MAG: diaminopimelate epimerase [Pseudomonadales bacterium]|nr:diaminopimelate epimerase [Pseudomonadales bacterium]MCP5184107.1 diaminopimelate epimerase [Pseudomonadales bacterium]